MDYLANNLKFLRRKRSATQEEMAHKLKLKKSTYASYETEDGNMPPSKTLYTIAKYFEVSMISLFDVDYTTLKDNQLVRISDEEIYFPVSVDMDGTELIDVVPSSHSAQAGYLSDYSDPSYIQSLPKINWNLGAYQSGTMRIFQISGDSMLPIPSQSFILGVRETHQDLVDHQAYIIITNHDILFKRLRRDGPNLHLLSDNALYPAQTIAANDVRQYWKVLKVIMDMPHPDTVSMQDLNETLRDTNEKVKEVLNVLKSR